MKTADLACAAAALPATSAVVATPTATATLNQDAASVAVGEKAVTTATTITGTSLCADSLPPLDQGMTNVTAGPRRGYRFLPHMTFGADLKISLPYDPALIPAGLGEEDVRAFYYDEAARRWTALEREKLDTAARRVGSVSDHFTDMIAATVTVPDHPGTLSYDPTTMKGIKAADPAEGMNLVEPPAGDSHGDAKLSYPIVLPQGRHGMQPSLTIGYSSAQGNGWLGVGWDLDTPAVTIDTRWGVPRYDDEDETETYVFGGEQLTPVAHRGALQPRTAEKVFHTRVESAFRTIVRHGSSPDTYSWEITEKDGTRSFYGADAASRLTDAAGNVFRWALSEVRDLYGNAVRYTYQTVTDAGVAGGTVPGKQLYPREINYTGSGSAAGPYTVRFVRDSELPGYTRRADVGIDAKGGFKMVTAELLKRIEIRFEGAAVRSYDLDYTEGAFRKSLLRSVTQRGADGTAFHTHTFGYYDEVRDGGGGYEGFAAGTNWSVGSDGVTAGLLDHGQASAMSGALSTSVGGHLYVGFNPTAPTKQFSAGGKVGFQHSRTDGKLAMVDLNGDNLPDKVFKKGNGISFRLNDSGPDGSTDFRAPAGVPTLPDLTKETSSTFSFGGEVYFVANVFTNRAETFTTNSVYFSDVNGDGLMDLVTGGSVRFNHLDGDGIPTFTANSGDTPVPIGSGAVDGTGIVEDFAAVREQQIDNNPLADTLRRWVAPFAGKVRVTGDVALIEDTSPARQEYGTADGVRVAIQHNGGELWSSDIGAADHAPKTPAGVAEITVAKGDRLYFRVQSRFDGAFDEVSWDPAIDYLDVTPATDVNNLNVYGYRAAQDFVLAGRRGVQVQAPLDGKVKLTGDLRKLGATTDDVELLVFRNGSQISSQSLAAADTGAIPVNLDIPVAKQDAILLRVKVDSAIDLRQLEWTPKLFYTEAPGAGPITDENGDPLVQLRPPYDIDMYPVNGLTAPQQAWTAPATETITINPQTTGSVPGSVTFTVKRRGERLAKQTVNVGASASLSADVQAGDQLFFDFSAYDPQVGEAITGASVEVTTGGGTVTVPSAVHRAAFPGLLAQPYRGWAYAGYNGNRDRAAQPIVETDLLQEFDENSTYDPRTAKAYLFSPFPDQAAWRSADDRQYVKAATAASSRMGLDQITVPAPGDFTGGRAVNRLSRASQTAVGAGVSFLSGSASDGSATGEVDFLDLNGDHFPDIVGNGRVQYSTMTGGLETANRQVAGLGKPRDSDASAVNVGVGGSPAHFKANGRGEVDTSGHAPPKGSDTGGLMTELGLSAGLGRGDSTPQHDLLDVNGDGLPDRAFQDGRVALNLGYAFAAPEPWGTGGVNDGASENGSIGASLGFNSGIYDFAGGLSLSKNKSQTSFTLQDVNGDGLMDRVLPGGDGMRVGFNTGNGFAAPVPWQGALNGVCEDDTSVGLAGIDWDKARICSGNTGLGAGAYFTIGIGPLCWPTPLCYIIINPGADGSQNMSRDEAGLRDVDGDGYADHVASTGDGSLKVARNRTGRTNLLKSVQRPLGASFTLEYERDGNTVASPASRWVMSKVTLTDGHAGDGADTQVSTYTYEGGVFNRLEREFYGYAKVTEQQRDTLDANAVYRSFVREYRTDSYYTRGLLSRERRLDAGSAVFSDLEQTYVLRDVTTGDEPAGAGSTTATIFPQLRRTDERFNEGQGAPGKSTFTTNHYDELGNIDVFTDAGDTGAADDVVATTTYSDCPGTHVSAATGITVTGGGQIMRRREATIDCATGDPSQIRQYLESGAFQATDLTYTADGTLETVENPPNAGSQRYKLTYEYDTPTRTHIAKVSDSFGLFSSATYDLRFGTTLTETDLNGNRTTYVLDEFGRATAITGPYEQGESTPTIRFEYHQEAAVPWALTRHNDKFRSAADTVDTVTFVDGLRRGIQSKQDATVHTGEGGTPADVMSVSGRVTFDAFGRQVASRYPVTEPLGTPGAFNTAADSVAPTRLAFDVLDRNIRLTQPDDTEITTEYGFGPDRSGRTQFRQVVTDPKGHSKATFRDVREVLVGLRETHDGQPIWTSYAYSPLKELLRAEDDAGNATTQTFDNLGRRTEVHNPDSGRNRTEFDLANNAVARMNARGRRTTFSYDFNRVTAIGYPDFPGNNVTYAYGPPGADGNRAGRVSRVTDQSGSEERFYGRLGEVVKEVKTIAGFTGSPPKTYTTSYTYDTFGRLQSLVYPDSEVLTYRYDSGGMVRQATGVKGGHAYAYVNRMEYDKFGQRAFVEDGNGIRTSYAFDPIDRRLANLKSGPAGGPQPESLFQNLDYTYDDVGNLTELANDVAVPQPPTYGGPVTKTFAYDDLDRLVASTGSWRFAPNKTDRYRFTQSYDNLHNLTAKQQAHEIVQPSGSVVEQHKTTYSFSYEYGGPQPHAPTHIGGQTYTYDAGGNQTGWTDDQNGRRRTIVWDEENRIQSLFDNGHEKTYKYDDAGERVIKRGPQGETAYVNQWFTVRNGQIGTKHVFAGGSRMVSKLVKQDPQVVEQERYFYHSDHLGGTNFVSDADGRLYQHLEYFPSGETWAEEHNNTQRTPYQFSGKELDEETGLYYFGARYYDPRTGVWQSPDPALETNLGQLPESGTRTDQNLDTSVPTFLNVYNYADANPLSKIDPDGRQAVPLTTTRLRAIATAQGIGAGLSGVQFNRAVGRAFQDFALNRYGLLENFRSFASPARAAATGPGGPRSVIPDAVRHVTQVTLRWWIIPQLVPFANSSFTEVKAVSGTLTLSSSNHQIRGLIDVAARSPAGMATGPGRPLPVVTFITTADTIIGPDVVTEATRRGVALWQITAFEVPSSGGAAQIGFNPAILLNPSVFGRGTARPGPTGPFTPRPFGPAATPANPLDPDPAEVQ
ncbi:SpvB/TcaC N-terminal domain-containing protein [Nonomuraea typhae]|uniref:SpvB/TcaC N-terminal domain-containing protein n=1 Tax=Nonomuraea typhae TaxID=2603600 RepID=UPI0015E21F8E|nr:SpvB/TcaC N-terminal domain-containing protein [Nonomuraea typhae]